MNLTPPPQRPSDTVGPAPSGPAAAAFLACGLGCATLGLMTVLVEASAGAKQLLAWWAPAGPLVGVSGVAVAVWLVSWAALHRLWSLREIGWPRVSWLTLALVTAGFALTFPPVYKAFGAS